MSKYYFSDIAINSTEKKKPVEEDKYTYLGLENLDPERFKVSRIGSDVAPTGDKLIMRKGDVLFGRRGAFQRKVAIAPIDGIFSAHGMVLRPKEDVVDKDFFPMFISSDEFISTAMRISVGSLSLTVNWKDLKQQEFYLPEMDEQKKIAKLLWALERTKEAYRDLFGKTDELIKAQFIEQFWEKDYPVVRVEEICDFVTKGTTPPTKEITKEPVGDSVPYLKVYNLSFDGTMLFEEDPQYISREIHNTKLARSKVFPGDVLMNIVGPPLGKFAIVPDSYSEWNINQAIAIFRAKERIRPRFLLYALMQPAVLQPFLNKAVGVRQLNISLEQCRNIEIPLPSLDLQDDFVIFAEQCERSKKELQKSIEAVTIAQRAILHDCLSKQEV